MKAIRSVYSILCLILVLGVMVGCGKHNTVEQDVQSSVKDAQTEEIEVIPAEEEETGVPMKSESEVLQEEIADIPVEQEEIDPYVVFVDTPYGRLFYQEQWAEFMKTEQIKEGDILLVRFCAEIDGVDYPLFSLSIGGGEGEPAAALTDSDGIQRDVYVIIEEIVEQEGFSEEEQNRLYAMQEEINYVMQNIK